MTVLSDGSARYLSADIEGLPWLGEGGDLMKILHVDEQMGQAVFIQRFARNTRHLTHTHHCTAVAYTLSGCWAYDGEPFPQGAVAFEPYGSTHTPMTQNDNVADVLVVVTAGPGNPRLLELHGPNGSVELDMAAFRRMAALRSNEEWPALLAELQAR